MNWAAKALASAALLKSFTWSSVPTVTVLSSCFTMSLPKP